MEYLKHLSGCRCADPGGAWTLISCRIRLARIAGEGCLGIESTDLTLSRSPIAGSVGPRSGRIAQLGQSSNWAPRAGSLNVGSFAGLGTAI